MANDGEAPLHAQVRSYLMEEVESGRLAPGDRVPTENELMERFGVSRTTVRRALQDLVASRLIDRASGRGTFVRHQRIEQELRRLTGFVEDMEALGLQPSALVVTNNQVPAPREVARQLQVRIGDPVVHIERVRLANRRPVSFDDSYFPLGLGERIAREDLEVHPFYSILEDRYGMPLGEADLVLEATEPGERIGALLNIDAHAPIMRIERTTYSDKGGTVLLFEYLYYRGDRMRYRLHLSR